MAWITDAEVKAILGISGTDQDAQISALLDPICEAIDGYVGYPIELTSHTENVTADGSLIFLSAWPVTAIASVTDRSSGTELPSSEYKVSGSKWAVEKVPFGGCFLDGLERYEVVYDAGHSTAPNDLKSTAALMVQAALDGQSGKVAEKEGDYSYAKGFEASGGSVGIPPFAQTVLNRYRGKL